VAGRQTAGEEEGERRRRMTRERREGRRVSQPLGIRLPYTT
jgi:aminoglycoside phosphotransferase (APT) family kinase protein